jgi:L-malate glycosyltransferase
MTSGLCVLHLDTERGWRGGERQVLWLAQTLDPPRYRSIVVARPSEPLAIRASAAGIPVEPLRPLSELDPFAIWSLHRMIGAHRAAIVHAHTAHAVALAAVATRGTPARVVVTRRVDFRLRDTVGSRWKYGRADAVIAISRAVADALVASGIARDRIELVPSGIDLTRHVDIAPPSVLSALGIVPGAPLVVQVAQLVGHKDPVTFVEAVAVARRRVPNLQAVMVGDGPLRQQVNDAVERLGLQDVVHLPGYRTDADSLLAAADVVTLSSREEGLGTVLLDALALGKPVAATAGGGIPEIIEDGRSGLLVPVGDAAALGQAIAKLLVEIAGDPARLTEIAAAARARAKAFSMTVTADRTAAVYDRVLATKH